MGMSSGPTAMFEIDGDTVHPTVLTQGPWDPNAQYGGAPAALLTWATEQVPTLVPMRVARATVDLHRPVPIAPLHLVTRVLREGKRLQLVEATIAYDGVEVARATTLRLRLGAGPADTTDPGRPPVAPPPPPETFPARPPQRSTGDRTGFIDGMDVRHVGDGMSTAWYRVVAPVVAGEVASPTVRLAMVSDFTANAANYLDHRQWSCINPDLTMHLARQPEGDWFAVATRNWYEQDGIGHARADIFDTSGFVGTVTTAALVDEVPAPYGDA
jgi:hypothetical protein